MRLILTGILLTAANLAAAPLTAHSGPPPTAGAGLDSVTILPTLAEFSPSDMLVEDMDLRESEPFATPTEIAPDRQPPPLPTWGESDCLGPRWSLAEAVCGPCRPFEIGGWTQIGYHDGLIPLSRSENDLQSFEDIPHHVQLNQQWFYAERLANTTRQRSDWGFRLDIVYGTDAQKTQAFGNPGGRREGYGRWDASLDHGKYGWAIPQAYLEYATGDWNVIVGHFFSPLGYEVIPSVGNFFYTRSLTMFNSEPFTHTGALASWSAIDDLTFYGGWSAGWDSGFDSYNGGSNFIGGFAANLTDNITFTYLTTAGNFGRMGDEGGAISHSIVMTAQLTGEIEYVLQSDALDADEGLKWQRDTIGLNQYLFYTFNEQWKAGLRTEWWKADGQSFYEVTYGLNYRPHANVVIRPELRHDWSPGDDYSDETFSIDLIFAY